MKTTKKIIRMFSLLVVLAFVLQLATGLIKPIIVSAEEVTNATTSQSTLAVNSNDLLNEKGVKTSQISVTSSKNTPSKIKSLDINNAKPNAVQKKGMKRLTDAIAENNLGIKTLNTGNPLFEDSFVVDEDMYLDYGDNIHGYDVYIAPEATLYVFGDSSIYGEIINYGTICLYAELYTPYNVYAYDYKYYVDGDQIYYGDILNMVDDDLLWCWELIDIFELPELPIGLYSSNKKNVDGYLPLIEGAVLPIFELELEGIPVPLRENGTFTLNNYYVGTKTQLEFIMTDFFGSTFIYEFAIETAIPKVLTSIEINRLPRKLNYITGQQLDLTGLVVYGVYSDKTKEIVSITKENVSGYNPNSKVYGPQTVTISYGGKTAKFTAYLDRFTDVPYGYDFYSTIMDLSQKGIVVGYADGRYGINDNITRAEVAVMLVRALGLSIKDLKSNFTDVPNTHWAAGHIAAAAKAGILNGYGDGRFGPSANITRSELAVMVANAFKVKINSNKIVTFTDVPSNYWAGNHIQALASNGILSGYGNGSFGVKDKATRAQFSKFLSFTLTLSNK